MTSSEYDKRWSFYNHLCLLSKSFTLIEEIFVPDFNFLLFILLAKSTKFCGILIPYRYTSVCDNAVEVRKCIAYEIFTRTKISAITVCRILRPFGPGVKVAQNYILFTKMWWFFCPNHHLAYAFSEQKKLCGVFGWNVAVEWGQKLNGQI